MGKKMRLVAENICFAFDRNEKLFFENLNAAFEVGKVYFIRGENGAGKSTFFRILQGKIDQQERVTGLVSVDGDSHDFSLLSSQMVASPLKTIKMVQQKFDLMLADQLSFKRNLQLANIGHLPRLHKLPMHHSLPSFVSRFKIDMEKPVHLLSGGQRQILSILMALQKPAKILLLDEPTAALDEQNSNLVMAFLSSIVKEADLTVLIICHDKQLVDAYAIEGYYEMWVDSKTTRRLIRWIKR